MPVIDQGFDDRKYHVIPRTLIFLFDSLNRVLLIKGSDKKQRWPGKYNGVGGHIESGEDILEAALRVLHAPPSAVPAKPAGSLLNAFTCLRT